MSTQTKATYQRAISKGMRIGLFMPCYIDMMFPEVGIATLQLLKRFGLNVGYPLDQTCCGQPMSNSGDEVNAASAEQFSDPEAVRFSYKLQEADKHWHEVAAATPVTYRNLPPGSYHFGVEASDTNGVWSGAPASMAFAILPAFYQTDWFHLLCVAAFLAFLWGLHQLRLQQLLREETKLREAIETIPAMAWMAGPDGAIQFRNRRGVEYTGLSQIPELKELRKLLIHPEDLDRSE